VRLVYLAKAMSKRVSKVDDNEDVFEADDMVQWEGGWALRVEARRRGRGDRSALVVASPTPRGHPVPIMGSALVAEGTGFGRTLGCHTWRWRAGTERSS